MLLMFKMRAAEVRNACCCREIFLLECGCMRLLFQVLMCVDGRSQHS